MPAMATTRYCPAAVAAGSYLYGLGGSRLYNGVEPQNSVEFAAVSAPAIFDINPVAISLREPATVTVTGMNFLPAEQYGF